MGWLRNAWTAASRMQKLVIIIALLISLGTLPDLVKPIPPAPRSGDPVAHVSPLSTAADLDSRAPEAATLAPTTAPQPTPVVTLTPSATPSPTPSPTPIATASPTPRPTPTPDARRTAAPTTRPTASLSLAFRSLTSPIHRGSNATASVRTVPGAQCDIDVEYKSGSSTAAGLVPKVADRAGNASWTWKVGTRTTPGSWPVTVTCLKGGRTRSVRKDFQVI